MFAKMITPGLETTTVSAVIGCQSGYLPSSGSCRNGIIPDSGICYAGAYK